MKLSLSYIAAISVCIGIQANTHASSLISDVGDPGSDAALTGGGLIDFESVAIGDYASLIIADVTFAGDSAITIGNNYAGQFNTTGQSVENGGDSVPNIFTFDFATTVSAFAFNWGAADVGVWAINAYDTGGSSVGSYILNNTFGSNSGEYVGIAAAGIASASLTNTGGGDYIFIDNFAYKNETAVVPLPAAVWFFGSAMIGLVGFTRKKARIAAA